MPDHRAQLRLIFSSVLLREENLHSGEKPSKSRITNELQTAGLGIEPQWVRSHWDFLLD